MQHPQECKASLLSSGLTNSGLLSLPEVMRRAVSALHYVHAAFHWCTSHKLAGVGQAHFINNRTMEVFRQLPWHGHTAGSAASGSAQGAGEAGPGLGSALGSGSCGSLADAVAAASPPLEQWRRFVYCESALGRVLGEMDHFEVRTWMVTWARLDCRRVLMVINARSRALNMPSNIWSL